MLSLTRSIKASDMQNGAPTSFFKEEIPSNFDATCGILDRAVEALQQHNWLTPERESCTRLCLEEALVNAVRHGNGGDAKRTITLEMCDCGDYCKIKVKDEGEGFCTEDIDLPDPDQEGGRGICLIKHYMDYAEFNRKDHCLEMRFNRNTCCKEA